VAVQVFQRRGVYRKQVSHLYLDMESANHSTAELTVFNATKSNIVPLENDMHLEGKSGRVPQKQFAKLPV
jgi:hypothetical protein